MIKEIHIFDFDGTLVDSSHRYRTQICDDGIERIDLDFWVANECKTMQDECLPMVDKFRNLVNDSKAYALIATARIWCDLSEQFAFVHNLIPNGLVARRDRNDHRGGAALKIAHVNRLLNLKQFKAVDTIHVYEDNYSYLMTIMDAFRIKGFSVVGHYIPSNQGH